MSLSQSVWLVAKMQWSISQSIKNEIFWVQALYIRIYTERHIKCVAMLYLCSKHIFISLNFDTIDADSGESVLTRWDNGISIVLNTAIVEVLPFHVPSTKLLSFTHVFSVTNDDYGFCWVRNVMDHVDE